MSISRNIFVITVLFVLVSLNGCSDVFKASTLSASSAQKKLIEICKNEHGLDIKTESIGKTLWVYLPARDPILSIESAKDTKGAQSKSKKFSILFLDGSFNEETFDFEYDIISKTKVPGGPGYSTPYTEKYTEKRNNITRSVFRAYADAGEVPGDIKFQDPKRKSSHKKLVDSYVKTEQPPDFFVIVIADIVTGIKTKEIFYFADMKRYMSGTLPLDEYTKRYLSELKGNKSIIGDKIGKHLNYKEITWPEFLTEQILHRIRFKYQRSDFPPEENAESEILKIVARVTGAYDFDDFTSIALHDLRARKDYAFGKDQLKTFKE